MNLSFPAILILVTLFCGVVTLMDTLFNRKKNTTTDGTSAPAKKPVIIDYARAFFPVLLVVLLIRTFVVQPYRVPTGSLKPTIMPGDFILVNQFKYGLRIPVWLKTVFHIGEPKVGQIGLFHWPVNTDVTFVKRVIGVPGDKISYINKVLYVNGVQAKQKFLHWATDSDGSGGPSWKVGVYQEDLNGVKHNIYICPQSSTQCPNRAIHNFYNMVVPKGEYFMMGDNRDNSDDSRDWGFVPQRNFIGEAMLIWMSWNSAAKNWLNKIRWDRLGTLI